MIRKRLTVRFVWQLVMSGAILAVVAIAIVTWMLGKFAEIEMNRNFAPLGISQLIAEATIDAQGLIVDPKLLQRLQEDGGWLQSLDGNGSVLQSFNAPDDLPTHYIPGKLMDYWIGSEPFPYKLGMWIQEKDGHLYTLLYGARSQTEDLLRDVMADGQIQNDMISFSAHVLSQIDKAGSSIQVLDSKGVEIAAWRKPIDAPKSYSLQELAMGSNDQVKNGMRMDTRYDDSTGLTWVYHYRVNDGSETQLVGVPIINTEAEVIIIGIATFLILAFLVFVSLSLWYANWFVAPIIHILGWIQRLGKGDYTKGTEKRNHRIFIEVMESIHTLAATLQAARDAEALAQKNRAAWIAGVTHDMKTPLSSIKGYAHMLEAENYSWSEDEVREFASTILEKSAYIDKLNSDLALTFRLKSGDIPVKMELKDIGMLLPESIRSATSHPMYESERVRYSIPSTPIMAMVYSPWFDRIVDNLIANAFIHNSEGTRIDIELSKLPENGWRIDFSDDGRGMNEQTIKQLFERYYRGTDTESAVEGSGLGMAVTKELVQAMGGRIKVNSRLGKGTMISIIWDASR
ncbi:HAMP domain-containing histidine kinase [Paenibacillus sp. GSMTC-2017]|uniref:sensor histidine kinase n=1 Tax=Paenibacillus sp. GSMTC-2017 TaxID=2794350 RepID=UPI0018D7443A|nr:HAMP domain-containing sensor histidine kinase [Paenibacillus sp. GSMTC-2017]MBH5319470.1 HAMP domain-containing histidine kinase [Paenibacillus sp. GSMTC-2017]